MSWQEVIEEIQSVEFDVSLNMASGTNNYFRGVSEHPVVNTALDQMSKSGDLREEAMGLIYDMANEEVDPEFENPNDTPLAVLLWLTNFSAPGNAQVAATYVDQAPYCWYAKKLAQRILHPPPSTTANHMDSQEPHEAVSMGSYSKTIRLTMPLIVERPLEVRGGNFQVESPVVVTMWQYS